jgi:hypothetical protein
MLMISGGILSVIYGCSQENIYDSRDVDKLQTDLNKLGECALENEMKINPGESMSVGFTKARVRERIKYYFGDQLFPEANSFKHLGITNYKQRPELARPWKLYLTKCIESSSLCNAYTQKGKQ